MTAPTERHGEQTPGPWQYDMPRNPDAGCISITDGLLRRVADIFPLTLLEAEANARLIATAPDRNAFPIMYVTKHMERDKESNDRPTLPHGLDQEAAAPEIELVTQTLKDSGWFWNQPDWVVRELAQDIVQALSHAPDWGEHR